MHDHMLSGAPTPSGIETPRPDFQDKRMPGIMHSYFGQVGKQASSKFSRSFKQSVAADAQAVTTTAVDAGLESYPSKHIRPNNRKMRSHSAASLDSLVKVDRSQIIDTPPASDDMNFDAQDTPQDNWTQPPTPISSDPYEVQKDGGSAENGGPLADGGLASITQALRNFVRPKTQASRHQSLPTSSLMRGSVPAAHISNPTSSTQSPQSTCPSSPPPKTMPSSTSIKELNKLTLDAAPESREKNTPPLTPRALSQADPAGARSPRSNASATASEDGANSQRTSTKQDTKHDEPATKGAPRGKLKVKISQGRGLRPSVEPYCVCVFEWNEYISQGPKNDQMDVDTDDKRPNMASIPIKRTDSEIGRSMAIPMRSRQSSTNGLEDRGMEKVTDPQWDGEATL